MNSLADRLKKIVGEKNVFAGSEVDDRYTSDMWGRFGCSPGFVVRPASTEEVIDIVNLARGEKVPITPLGGRTGAVGGGHCSSNGIILSLERMNRILEIDALNMTATVEAGAILQNVHEAVEAQGLLMPLDLGARGSATIGGNISTNAGGLRVLRWGMMRDMVIGLEAVLANGSVVSSLGKTLKDNAGYNWKHLLIGGEGSLGIVTKAVLRLRPLPVSSQTALAALDNMDQAIGLLRKLEAELGGQLSSYELMWNNFYDFVSTAQLPRRPRSLPVGSPLYAVFESLGSNQERDRQIFEEVLSDALEQGLIKDVVIAQSERERANLWAVRDDLGEPFAPLWPLAGFDVSMSLTDMEAFVERAERDIRAKYPKAVFLAYGHAGDGNLHLLVSVGSGEESVLHDIDETIYRAVHDVHGSISAEHGIGLAKLDFIKWTRSESELELMRAIKRALDPDNILNPGKVVPALAH